MSRAKQEIITGKGGLRGTVERAALARSTGPSQVEVTLDSGERVLVSRDALSPQSDGTYYIPLTAEEIMRADGRAGADARVQERVQDDGRSVEQEGLRQEGMHEASEAHEVAEDGGTVKVPVIVEDLEVGKREVVTGRVRVAKQVRQHEEVVDEPLLREEVEVRRVRINEPVDGPVPPRFEGDTMIIPLVEEVLVVERRFVVREEMHIRKRRTEVHDPQRVVLRSEHATVERINNDEQAGGYGEGSD
jgi:uncharacterized protein (TIGR02271 family)